MEALTAQLQSSLQAQDFSQLAPICDAAELQNLWKALDLEWSPQLQPLVKALSSKLRGDMLGLVMRAYSNLSPGKLGVLLGLPEQEAMQLAREQGWELDEASGLLLVKSRPAASQAHASQQQLQRLAEFVVHLEA
ncbi:hypothetical protein N2152v2_007946 [Parachlorella kessleri]